MIRITEPTIARFSSDYADKLPLLKSHMKYIDKKVDYDIKRLKNNAHWYVKDLESQAAYEDELAQLKLQRQKSLLFEDEQGLYTYSGIAHTIAQAFQDEVKVDYKLPSTDSLPYANPPKHSSRWYQDAAHKELLVGALKGPKRVEIGTGLGKSTIIRMLVKHVALKTVIMAPSTSIAEQLYDDLVYHFGKRYVGFFGGGKKQSDKLIVVGIDDSLTKVEPGSDHWKALSSAKMFIADESHLCPADTLAKVCMGLCKAAPYRFFFSATQVRPDGLEMMLDAITGETVFSMTVKEGVDQGFLAKPHFRMVEITSDSEARTSDPNKLTRLHLYYNNKVIRAAADLANKFVSKMKRPTIILVEELEQFSRLLPYLKHEVKFAHGPLTAESKKHVAKQYQDDKPNDLVEQFNAGKIPILVGTSCITTGTDLQVVGATIYLMGKSSEIKTKQAVGRDTRGGLNSFVYNPWTKEQKLDCIHVDFDIVNIENLHRHSLMRRAYYEEIYGPVETVDMRGM